MADVALPLPILSAAVLVGGYNVVVALVYGADKWFAKRGSRRIPERTLLGLAAAFGAPGAWAGMRIFRHKTRKPKFRLLVPLLLVLQAALVGAAAIFGEVDVAALLR